MSLGKFIARRRKYLKMSQEELAEKIYVSKSAVAKWETDGGIPDRDNLFLLSGALGVEVKDLYRIIDSANREPADLENNITADVIHVLESYGYEVIRPKKKEG